MNATELFHVDGKTAGIYYCGKCRHVARDQETAERCCKPNVCECGAECPQYWTVCDGCRRKKDAANEQARFDAAEKVTAWNGPVMHGDDYARNLDELLDCIEPGDEPEYVWTCHERPVCHLDADHIIENATQEAYEDFDPDSLDGKKELITALDKFNETNKENVCWEPNYKLALVLGAVGRAAGAGVGDDDGESETGALSPTIKRTHRRGGSEASPTLKTNSMETTTSNTAAPSVEVPRLVRLWEIEDADLTDDQLSEIIAERYAPPMIPKCRLCGADLECGSSGGGQPSRWYCSKALTGENRDWEHYGNSLWEDRKQGGDSRVMETAAPV